MYLVKTTNGRYYKIDLERGFWYRSTHRDNSQSWGQTERIWSLRDYYGESVPYDEINLYDLIGKQMFISSKDVWWVTSPVVSVELVDETA